MVFATPLSRSRGILAGFAFVALFATLVYSSCDNGHHEYANKCYKFTDRKKSRDEGQRECNQWRGNLVTILDSVTNDFVGNKCREKDPASYWWLGLLSNNNVGHVWATGQDQETQAEFFHTPDLKWEDARQYCVDNGGELASIENRDEENRARRECPRMPCWIGLVQDTTSDTGFRWLDGSTSTYTHWLGFQPQYTQPYVALFSSCGWFDTTGLTWRGRHRKYNGVCRRRVSGFDAFEPYEVDTEGSNGDTNGQCSVLKTSTKKWKRKQCDEDHCYVCSRDSYECKDGSTTRLYGMTGYISDGPLSTPYSNKRDCKWVILPPIENSKIKITIDHFVTEEIWDTLHIYDGPDTNAPLLKNCNGGMNAWEPFVNTCPQGTNITSSGNAMTLIWDTDYCITSEGFGLFYETISDNPCEQCHADAECWNSEECRCKNGFEGTNGFVCDDVDECARNFDDCDLKANCENTHGSFECKCDDGYENINTQYPGVAGACQNVDECEENSHTCDSHADCEDTVGGYDCDCKTGWEGNGQAGNCTNIDECADDDLNACHVQASCADTQGWYVCTCNDGYEGPGDNCQNIDECDGVNDCHTNADCVDNDGSYTCACIDGYEDTVANPTYPGVECRDVNECTADPRGDDCDIDNGRCINNVGGYSCSCNAGFDSTDQGRTCKNMDECASTAHHCDADHGICNDETGSFSCSCQSGYELINDATTCNSAETCKCVDTHECNDGTHACNANAECENTEGDYTCTCLTGWNKNGQGRGDNGCSNVNECGQANECNEHAACDDSEGSYSCPCNSGWTGDGWGASGCEDVDECELPADNELAHNCVEASSTCANTDGSYSCNCKDGWTASGTKDQCVDVNECSNAALNDCDQHAACKNAHGNYTCTCNSGWVGNGTYCEDVDECATEEFVCDEHAVCINEPPGTYECECIDGWVGDGKSCSDEDECTTRTDICDEIAGTCADTEGSFRCGCTAGYVLDPADNRTCDDMDECAVFGHNCSGVATCLNTDGSFVCDCYDEAITMDTPCKLRCGEQEAKKCDNLAFCEDGVCICFEGMIGDGYVSGTGCNRESYAVRWSLHLPDNFDFQSVVNSKLKTWDFDKEAYIALFSNVTLPHGFASTLHHEVMRTEQGPMIVLNALFYTQLDARTARDELEKAAKAEPRECFGVMVDDPASSPLEPRVYRWVAPTSSAEYQVAPAGMEVEQVYFIPNCGNAGCWAVDVIYTTGTDTFNTFFIPKAEGDEAVPDFDYDVAMTAEWETTALDTFLPVNHPCQTFNYVADENAPTPSAVTACCLPEFISVYRTIASFAVNVEPFVVDECMDEQTIPLFMPGREYPVREGANYTAKPVNHLSGVFRDLEVSNVTFTGVIDPFIRQYTATFYLDDVELRQKAGILRGTVGVEYTIDTFVGLANFKPTGIEFLDPFATQVNIHLERTQYFAVSTHGVNEYTFLQYINLRLVAVYDEDTNRQGAADDATVTSRTGKTNAAHYVQVTFTLGDQYQPNANSGLIPLDSVLVGQGEFISNPTTDGTTPGMMHACDMWSAGSFAAKATLLERIPPLAQRTDQLCAPVADMCASPLSIPDAFVNFNIPLGIDWFPSPPTTSDLSQNVFVSLVVSAVDTAAQTAGSTPNDGEAALQMKTTLVASIPVVDGGMNIFCDGITAKTDLKDVADVDLIIGTAADMDELTRLTIFENIASTDMSSVDPASFDTASIEAGFMTLVVKGKNSSYFGRNGASGAFGLQLEDLITVHIMEDRANPTKFNAVKALLTDPGEDNFDTDNNLQTQGYKINGAFEIRINTVLGKASLHPTSELLGECSFRAMRPTLVDAFPVSCIIRRDVENRGYPRVGNNPATAMEVQPLRNSPTGTLVGMNDASRDANSAFMTTVLGESDYAKDLGYQFSYLVADKYQLNGQFMRAYWINPGYEWSPTQTGGQSQFTISQRVVLCALVAIDEGFSGSRRRVLLQAGTESADKLDESQSGLAAIEAEFNIDRFNMMAAAFDVPQDNVALISVELGLTDFQACMDEFELRPELRSQLETAVLAPGVASTVHTVQILALNVQKRGVDCRRRAELSRARRADSSLARVEMMVVFAETEELGFDVNKFKAADSSIQTVTPRVVSDAITMGEVTEVPEKREKKDNTVLIAGICVGVAGLFFLLALGAWLVKRQSASSFREAVVADGHFVGDLQFDKAQLMEETQDGKIPIPLKLSESAAVKSRSSSGLSGGNSQEALLAREAPVETEPTPAAELPRKASVVSQQPPAPAPAPAAPAAPIEPAAPAVTLVTEDDNGIPFIHPGYEHAPAEAAPIAIPKPDHAPPPPRLADQVYIATPASAIQRAIGASGLPEAPPEEEVPAASSEQAPAWSVLGLFGGEERK